MLMSFVRKKLSETGERSKTYKQKRMRCAFAGPPSILLGRMRHSLEITLFLPSLSLPVLAKRNNRRFSSSVRVVESCMGVVRIKNPVSRHPPRKP
jgi:hypothetical protein